MTPPTTPRIGWRRLLKQQSALEKDHSQHEVEQVDPDDLDEGKPSHTNQHEANASAATSFVSSDS